ncbi:MAG: hypothetical protein AAF752_03735 [Bacteroidota bacterium]
MVQVITFCSSAFDEVIEPEGINQTSGHALGSWVRQRLRAEGIDGTGIDAEDWGWYFEVEYEEICYLVGFCSLISEGNEQSEHIIQIHRHRTLWQRATGAGTPERDDAFTAKLVSIAQELSPDVSVERE